MKTEVKNDNELIAEFMGLNVSMFGPVLYLSDEDGMIDFKNDAEPYWPDRNWNQLMPVVEKIEQMTDIVYSFEIHIGASCRIYADGKEIETMDDGIDGVYKAVVEFIRWYNSQTTSNSEQS